MKDKLNIKHIYKDRINTDATISTDNINESLSFRTDVKNSKFI